MGCVLKRGIRKVLARQEVCNAVLLSIAHDSYLNVTRDYFSTTLPCSVKSDRRIVVNSLSPPFGSSTRDLTVLAIANPLQLFMFAEPQVRHGSGLGSCIGSISSPMWSLSSVAAPASYAIVQQAASCPGDIGPVRCT